MSELTPQPEQHAFKLHLPGLLKVLAEHLYSNRQVAVRELIQNAHDSCVRRATGDWAPEEYQPRIRIRLDAPRRRLVVEDNGSGLTESEINDYLSTIGRSYTRELKENLSLFSPDEAARLIGQFGFGFLSAFLLASEVTVTTKSMQPGAPALQWRSAGDEHYEITPAERAKVGTTIELKVKTEAGFVLDEKLLLDSIRRFADFLPIPIYLNDGPEPVNLMSPPWEGAESDEDEAKAIYDYIGARMPHPLGPPLVVIPLQNHRIDLGHDAIELPLSGFLMVPPGSVASVREYGDLTVYIRQMYIREDEKHLLPSWARFVRGVVDCPYLQPTASREDIHQDETFGWVRDALEHQLGTALRQLAEQAPEVWNAIVRGHTDLITSWAVRDDGFWNQVADVVTFRTTRGQLTLPEYLALTDGEVYYVTRELGSLQEQLLAEGHGVPVIDGSWFFVEPFLQKYARDKGNCRPVALDGNAEELLRPVEPKPLEGILSYYADQGVRAVASTFKPAEVPALMIYPRDAQFIADSRTALSQDELPAPLAGLVGEYLNETSADVDINGTLHLNSANPLVRRLGAACASGVSSESAAALDLVLHMARLFAGKTLTVRDAAQAFEGAGDALGRLWQGGS